MKFKVVKLKLNPKIDGWGISWEIALRWMSVDLTDDKSSTLVQVMAWCRQATSAYLSHCWPSFLLPYCFTRSWWVNVWLYLFVYLFIYLFICFSTAQFYPRFQGRFTPTVQGSFCECSPPIRDDDTLQRHLSLAGPIHKMIPAVAIMRFCPIGSKTTQRIWVDILHKSINSL